MARDTLVECLDNNHNCNNDVVFLFVGEKLLESREIKCFSQ